MVDSDQLDDGEQQEPEWEVGIRAWGHDDEPGEARWDHYHPRAPDKETAKERAIKKAKKPGIGAIIGMSDAYEVYQVAGPFEPQEAE